MKLYGALLSPFVRKVAVAAAEKGMPWELAVTSPGGVDADFLKASPFGKIPAIVDGDFTLADSSAIVHYLDAKQPAVPLIPAEARARGQAVWFDEFADTLLGASGLKILFHRLVGPKLMKKPYDEAIAAEAEAELPRLFAYLESVVPADGWLLGDFGLADIAVASVLRSMSYVGQLPPKDSYPTTRAWYARVTARASWQAVAVIEDKISAKIGIVSQE